MKSPKNMTDREYAEWLAADLGVTDEADIAAIAATMEADCRHHDEMKAMAQCAS